MWPIISSPVLSDRSYGQCSHEVGKYLHLQGENKNGHWKGSLLYTWWNWETERVSNLPEVTQLVSSRTQPHYSNKYHFSVIGPAPPSKSFQFISRTFQSVSHVCPQTGPLSLDQLVRSLQGEKPQRYLQFVFPFQYGVATCPDSPATG